MPITSDTLFHFTTSLNNLKNILSKKFLLTYCKEEITLNNKTENHHFPMISFCDIPLSLAKNHIDKYGSYAIGMTKEWGIQNKLNPVLYFEKDSLISKDIQDTMDGILKSFEVLICILKNVTFDSELDHNQIIKELEYFIKYFKNHPELIKHLKEISYSYINIFSYIKNYQGTLIRQDKVIRNYRFYDEREWRYVPAINDLRVKRWLNEEEFKKYRGDSMTKPLINEITLNFTSENVKYLIVKSSKDIPKLIQLIKNTSDLTKNSNDADILTTRILTVEQLNSDF